MVVYRVSYNLNYCHFTSSWRQESTVLDPMLRVGGLPLVVQIVLVAQLSS